MGAVFAVRWSKDGQYLLSGGKHLTLHSYPKCRRVASTRLPAPVYDVEFLDRNSAVAGEDYVFYHPAVIFGDGEEFPVLV